MTGYTKEAVESSGAGSTASADGRKSWADLSPQEQEAVHLKMSTLAVLSALNTLARRSGLTLEEFLKTEGSYVFQKIGPIPQVKDSIATITTSLSLVDDQGYPDYEALFRDFDAIFRNPEGPSLQPVTQLVSKLEPLPKAA